MTTLKKAYIKGNKKEVLNKPLVIDIIGTPFRVVEDELGHIITLGKFRIPNYYATLDEATARIKQTDWELISLYVYLYTETLKKNNTKNKEQ